MGKEGTKLEKTKESYKGSEKKLDKLQKRLEYFLANSPAVFYTCNFGGEWACTFMSQNIVNQLGYEPAMFCEYPNFWADHIHPDDRQRVFDGLPQLLEKGSHVREYRFLNKEGTYRWMRDELLLIYDSEGKPADCVGFWIDITEQKSAEEALRQSEERLQEAQHLAHVGSWDLDIITNVLVWSDESYRIFEIDKNDFEASYEAFLSTIHPDDRKAVDETYVKSVRDRTPYEIVHRLKFPDGRVKFVQERCVTFYSVAGDPLRSIGTVQDITERKQTEKQMQRQLQRLSALRSIDLAISSSLDIRMTLNIFIEHVLAQLGVDAGNVLLLNPHSNMLEYAASQGFRTNALRHSYVRLGEGYAGVAALEKRIVSISDIREGGFKQSKLIGGEDFITYYGVPLVAKGHVKGVLEIFHRNPLKPDEEWFEFLDALALQAAIAIDNNSLFYELERSNMDLMLAYDSTIEGWSGALDYRDKETEGHSQRVTDMTVRMAREMGMDERELVHVRRGALLHDIGKMGIPDSILLKPGALTEEEWKIMRLHPVYSQELLSKIAYLRPALDIPYCHHEKWDGTGYPRGLKRDQIPISARIFAVVGNQEGFCNSHSEAYIRHSIFNERSRH